MEEQQGDTLAVAEEGKNTALPPRRKRMREEEEERVIIVLDDERSFDVDEEGGGGGAEAVHDGSKEESNEEVQVLQETPCAICEAKEGTTTAATSVTASGNNKSRMMLIRACQHYVHVECLKRYVMAQREEKRTKILACCFCGNSQPLRFRELIMLFNREELAEYAERVLEAGALVSEENVEKVRQACAGLRMAVAPPKENSGEATAAAATAPPTNEKQGKIPKASKKGGKKMVFMDDSVFAASLGISSSKFASGTGYGGSADQNSTLRKMAEQARAKERALDQTVVLKLVELRNALVSCGSSEEKGATSAAPIGKRTARKKTTERAKKMWAVSTFRAQADDQTVIQEFDDKAFALESILHKELGPLLRDYLRNDSLTDILRRSDLYKEIFKLLEFFAKQLCLLPLLLLRVEKDDSESLVAISLLSVLYKLFCGVSSSSTSDSDGELGDPETLQFRDLVFSICSTTITQMRHHPHFGETSIKDLKLADFAKAIVSAKRNGTTAATLASKRPRRVRDDMVQNAMRAEKREDQEKAYRDALQGFLFREASILDLVRVGQLNHYYSKNWTTDSSTMFSGASQKKRLMRISRELQSLRTSLPLQWGSSIFCVHDTDRIDVLSVLIFGPEGTPYANGAFLFDLFIPDQFPSAPPHVILKTTAGGKVRFNPNLYADGKVCLSLLGTWSGPGWTEESTILQVLVSIQSLIMVEKPYFNEPGYESSFGTPSGEMMSKRYNENIREATIRYAMIDVIKNPPLLFRDVVLSHFQMKKDDIINVVTKWSEEFSGSSTKPRVTSPLDHFPFAFGDNTKPADGGVASSGPSFLASVNDLKTVLNEIDSSRHTRSAATHLPPSASAELLDLT